MEVSQPDFILLGHPSFFLHLSVSVLLPWKRRRGFDKLHRVHAAIRGLEYQKGDHDGEGHPGGIYTKDHQN